MTLLMPANSHARRSLQSSAAAGPVTQYGTLVELHAALGDLDDSRNITVVLALDERFDGHLTSLVERSTVPSRPRSTMCLILAVGSGRLPGLETIGDLACSGAALGWQEIVLEGDVADAVAAARATLRSGERLVVFMPAWHDADGVERELRYVA